jgi:hypothetical protein
MRAHVPPRLLRSRCRIWVNSADLGSSDTTQLAEIRKGSPSVATDCLSAFKRFEDSLMAGTVARRWRVVQLSIVLLVMASLKFDVAYDPFAHIQLLHGSRWPDPGQRYDATLTGCESTPGAERDRLIPVSCPDGNSDWAHGRAAWGTSHESDDVISLPSRGRPRGMSHLSSFVSVPPAPSKVLAYRGRSPSIATTQLQSTLDRLGRLRC